ncbi:UNVERIFIED_CONTAM: hypothetical protein NCL1_16007 [Trichonephila clavipes]
MGPVRSRNLLMSTITFKCLGIDLIMNKNDKVTIRVQTVTHPPPNIPYNVGDISQSIYSSQCLISKPFKSNNLSNLLGSKRCRLPLAMLPAIEKERSQGTHDPKILIYIMAIE